MAQIENKQQNGRFKPNHINNHFKYKWFKQVNCKTEIVKCINKAKLNYMLYTTIDLLERLKTVCPYQMLTRYGRTQNFLYCWWACKMAKTLWKTVQQFPKS